MGKIFLLSLLLCGHLLAQDSDLDGVDNTIDECPNTPFSDLVDSHGCSIRSLDTNAHYDIIVGAGYSQLNYASQAKSDTTSGTFQADYYHDNLIAQLSTSYFHSVSENTQDNGMGDTMLALYLKSAPNQNLSFQTGIGLLLPTYESGYNNESTDYLASISFQYLPTDTVSVFGGYSYTVVRDQDIPNNVSYQNTHAFYAGAGYTLTEKMNFSSSYAQSQSIYVGTEPIRTISANLYYQFDSHWFSMLDYRYGLSDSASDHEVNLRLGYYF